MCVLVKLVFVYGFACLVCCNPGFSGFLIWLHFLFKVAFSLGLGFCVFAFVLPLLRFGLVLAYSKFVIWVFWLA